MRSIFLFFRKVRHAALFAISMVILSVPGHILLADLQSEVMETKRWLEGTFVEWKEILECSKMCVHERSYPHILNTQLSC